MCAVRGSFEDRVPTTHLRRLPKSGEEPVVNHSHLSFLQHRFACLGRSINTLTSPGRNLVAVARHRHYYVPNNLAGFKVNVTELGLRDPNLLKDAGWLLHELWDRGDAAL